MYILFDWYKSSEADFESRRQQHRPHARVYVRSPQKTEFPKGGNFREIRGVLESYVEPGDICANCELFTGDYAPEGFVFLG